MADPAAQPLPAVQFVWAGQGASVLRAWDGLRPRGAHESADDAVVEVGAGPVAASPPAPPAPSPAPPPRALDESGRSYVGLYIALMGGLHLAAVPTLVVPLTRAHGGLLVALYASLALATAAYRALVAADPGRLPRLSAGAPAPLPVEVARYEAEVLRHGLVPPLSTSQTPWCSTCALARPQRSKHVGGEHGRCYARFDHYCVFTGGPVAGGNHRVFVAFLVLQGAHLVLAAACLHAWLADLPEWSWAVLCSGAGVVAVAAGWAVVLFTAFVAALLVGQLWNVARDMTANEAMNGARYEYVQERAKRRLTWRDVDRHCRAFWCA